jgi:phosphoglycolate phosphatase
MFIKSILFDLDGTLVDTSLGVGRALKGAIAAVIPGKETNMINIRSLIGPPVREMLKKTLPGMESSILNELEHRFRQNYDSVGWKECTAYDGVAETLARLARLGVKCFVVTNKRNMPAIRILKRLKLHVYFAEIVSWDSGVPPYASKGDMASYIINKHHLDSGATLLVGDSGDDAQAAQTCGTKFAAVAYGYGDVHAEQECRKDFVLNKFADLIPIVKLPIGELAQ